jgi:Ca2+-binding RTX toxin-like protein
MPIITGTEGADTLTAGSGSDTIDGLGGNDTLIWNRSTATSDTDLFIGGAGNDTLVLIGTDSVPNAFSRTTAEFTMVLTGAGDGTFTADLTTTYQTSPSSNSPIPPAGALNGRVISGSGIESFVGGGGRDIFDMRQISTSITVDGGGGDDSIIGGQFNDSIIGGNGADTLNGSFGSNTLEGGFGDDVLFYGGGAQDSYSGGSGIDTVSFVSLVSQPFFNAGNSLLTVHAITVFGAGADGFTVENLSTTTSSSFGTPGPTTLLLRTLVSAGLGVERFIGTEGGDRFLLSSFNNSVTIDGGAGGDFHDACIDAELL